jgi:hypothetical protein
MSLSQLVAWTQRAVFGWLFPQNDPNTGSEAIEFVSLGLAVLDDIWIGSSQYAKEVLGGSGTYGVLSPLLVHAILPFACKKSRIGGPQEAC